MWTSAPGPTTQVDLLVEEHRHLGRLHAALGDVVGVVERDRQVLARGGRAEQARPRRAGRRSAPRGELGEALEPPAASSARPVRPAARVRRREVDDLLAVDQAQPGAPPSSEKRQSLIGRIRIQRPAAIAASSVGRSRASSVVPSTIASPPFFIFTLAPVRRATSPEKSGSWPTSRTSPRPPRAPAPSKRPPRSSSASSGSRPSGLAGEPRGLRRPHPGAGQAGVDLDAERGQRPPAGLGLPLALRRSAVAPRRPRCRPRRRRVGAGAALIVLRPP